MGEDHIKHSNRMVKIRSGDRTYDAEGFIKRAAGICVNQTETQVLLVSSRRDSCLWIVPGGGIEPNEMPDCAAVREVREEAGVSGLLGRCLGIFENSVRRHRTSVYILVVTEEFEEWDDSRSIGRKRKWFSVQEAVDQLAKHKPVESRYVSLLLPPSESCPVTSSEWTVREGSHSPHNVASQTALEWQHSDHRLSDSCHTLPIVINDNRLGSSSNPVNDELPVTSRECR